METKEFFAQLWLLYETIVAWCIAVVLASRWPTDSLPGWSLVAILPVRVLTWFVHVVMIRAVILVPTLGATAIVVLKIRSDNRREAATGYAQRASAHN